MIIHLFIYIISLPILLFPFSFPLALPFLRALLIISNLLFLFLFVRIEICS